MLVPIFFKVVKAVGKSDATIPKVTRTEIVVATNIILLKKF
jgi:hypothetical protein